FQAEDGIRDVHVTGVQTCALPISPPIPAGVALTTRSAELASSIVPTRATRARAAAAAAVSGVRLTIAMSATPLRPRASTIDRARSAERRVGKDGRSRRPPQP